MLFVLLLRSGLSLKLARKGDPGLSIPQMLWAIVGAALLFAVRPVDRTQAPAQASAQCLSAGKVRKAG